MISPGLNLVMTVIGFAVSTMFIVFVCTRLICARIHLRNSRMALPVAADGSDLGIVGSYALERGIHGLEPVVVASFPTKKFGDQFFSSGQDTQCTVCLADYQEKDVLRILPFCGHTFHVTCIDIWLKQHSTCPVCRISLRDSPDRKRAMQPMYSPVIRSISLQETYVSDPCQDQFAQGDFSPRVSENQRMVSPQEDHLV
ncbi:RING-H2 finger protein ATL68-like [Canna indica]|uniref:RING-H2 finger protein ATL68-like n=1 Tax=Canna indica TaxID=4628 RepID=A0AAQ3Q7S6_9LILI|nr:RING-H2 finger protein ATL68-like [Canna indica]